MNYIAPEYLVFFAGILLAQLNCNREGGANRRLIESFSLSRTKDAPPVPSPVAIGADMYMYNICAQWFKCGLGCLP